MVKLLKARSAQIDGWIRNGVDIGFHAYDVALIESVNSRNFNKSQMF